MEAGKLVHVNGRELEALATFEPGGDLQGCNFSQTVAIKVAMAKDASSRPVHCLLAARTGLPDSREG